MDPNTSKVRSLYAGIVTAVTGTLAFIAQTPAEQQDAIVGPIVSVLPITWRPTFALVMKLVAAIAMAYGLVQSSKSGPQTPPKNPVNE